MIQSIHQYAWLIPLLPTLTAMILGVGLLSTRRIFNSQRLASASISILTLILTMIISIAIFWEQIHTNSAHSQIWSWLAIDSLSLSIGYLIDPLSAIMLVVVTTVAVAVMFYTHGYMQHDQGYVRFFTYLILYYVMI